MDLSAKLIALGITENKVKETLKNENLSKILGDISSQAAEHGEIIKSNGTLLYILGTKFPKQFHSHLPLLIKYIMTGKINSEAKLTAAMKFIQSNKTNGNLNMEEFELSCGVGVEVSQDEIESCVDVIISSKKEAIIQQRYKFNVGPLIGQVLAKLKWADSRKVKEEIDLQILTLLGPKREEDLMMSSTKNKEKSDNSKKEKVKETDNLPVKKQYTTMKEFLKTVQFHKPGDNYNTDGYVITDKTHKHLENHLKQTNGKVRTRFPPEPNGILHIGHAKAININFGYAAAHDGVCFLRYDDTNPEKEEAKFFEGILDMVTWLGYKPFKVTHSSDYFDTLYEWAKKLIKDDLAYVCHQTAKDVKGFNPPPSPWRNRPIEENLQLFEDMKNGKFEEGGATLRMKHVLEEGKQDPIMYRIKYVTHHRSGDTWCIYPTYDYTHCLCDSIEHITHSLCTKEFQSRRSSYYWLCNAVDVYCPVQWEYGRLNMNYAVVSKRKIAKLIESGNVTDWDDPRLFTLTALRRRGFPAEAINNFVATLGLTGAQIAIQPDALEACVRDHLNTSAPRAMAVFDPLKIVISNFPDASPRQIQVPNFPDNESLGNHTIIWDKEFFIEKSDFKMVEEKGYRRLTPKQSVGLRHCGYIITVEEVVKTSSGDVDHLRCRCDAVSDQNKPKAFIHWVAQPVDVEVRLYDRLFLHASPEDASVVPGGFLTDINPNSLTVVRALADTSVKDAQVLSKFQFERVGFFSVDPDSTKNNLVFNRTVTLKEDRGKN